MTTDTAPDTLPRYAQMNHGVLLCRECSTKSTGFMIPADEREDHDAWHTEQHVAATAEPVTWHHGDDPVNAIFPAYRASRTEADGSCTLAIIRVGDFRTFDTDGYSWEVSHDRFTWSGLADTLEAAMDAAGLRLQTAWHGLMMEGY